MRQLTESERIHRDNALALHHGDNAARPLGNTENYFNLGFAAGVNYATEALEALAMLEGLFGDDWRAMVKAMAQALIDVHNCLPYSSQDAYNAMPEDGEPFEYVQSLYEELLADMWEIANRFPPNTLEAGVKLARSE